MPPVPRTWPCSLAAEVEVSPSCRRRGRATAATVIPQIGSTAGRRGRRSSGRATRLSREDRGAISPGARPMSIPAGTRSDARSGPSCGRSASAAAPRCSPRGRRTARRSRGPPHVPARPPVGGDDERQVARARGPSPLDRDDLDRARASTHRRRDRRVADDEHAGAGARAQRKTSIAPPDRHGFWYRPSRGSCPVRRPRPMPSGRSAGAAPRRSRSLSE